MREYIVNDFNEGQRLDKYVLKLLPLAPNSLIQKMIRKKNIVINDKKSTGKENLHSGDIIKIYMSDETIEKFSKSDNTKESVKKSNDDLYVQMPPIVYEDNNIIVVNKPAGMLSQKADINDVSCNDVCLSYVMHNNELKIDDSFKPSICNRLDRNTTGLLIFAKTYAGARWVAKGLKDRTINKFYYCVVDGIVTKELTLKGTLIKNHESNKVYINTDDEGADSIYTHIKPIDSGHNVSLLEIHLITGKTHQIRAHLASIGHPIIGDYKYGNRSRNDYFKQKYGIKNQLLCAYRIKMPVAEGILKELSEREIVIEVPTIFKKVIEDGNMEIKRS